MLIHFNQHRSFFQSVVLSHNLAHSPSVIREIVLGTVSTVCNVAVISGSILCLKINSVLLLSIAL